MGDMEPKKCLGCCELPEHLIDEILSWLPLQSLCRFRSVCQQWDALISSTKFITTKWAEKPPNRKPWLVVQWQVLQERRERRLGGFASESKMSSSLAHCFFTRIWKKTSSISLSFLLQRELHAKYPIHCYGSAAGLFLVGTAFAFVVSNPLTRTSLQLPPLSSIRHIFAINIVGGEGDNRDTYKVVAVGKSSSGNAHVVEVYNSTEKSWRIAGHLPEDVRALGTGMGKGMDMVFCRGSFYYLTVINGEWDIKGFSIREGTSVSAPLPDVANQKGICPYLLACESRVLVTVGIVEDGKELLQDVIIWEFEMAKVDSPSSPWKEIARMSPSLCERVNRCLYLVNSPFICPFMCCVGVGDCTCFIINGGLRAIEVVVYSASEDTWSWLPSCSLDDSDNDIWAGYVMAFEPRPDMKVG
jgi:hypothetical protein